MFNRYIDLEYLKAMYPQDNSVECCDLSGMQILKQLNSILKKYKKRQI